MATKIWARSSCRKKTGRFDFMAGVYTVAKITEIAEENAITKTITLEVKQKKENSKLETHRAQQCESYRATARFKNSKPIGTPGQFIMVWLPGLGEKPFSLAGWEPLKLTIAGVGEFSKRILSKKKGDLLHFRGPYGNGLELKGKSALFIGGGYGAARMRFAARLAAKKGMKSTMILGARTKELLLRKVKIPKCGLLVATDDGSEGARGYVTDVMAELLKAGKQYDCVHACGPEIMMKNIALLCKEHGLRGQFLLERVFKCGFGICGQCAIDDKLVCFDGPMFELEEVLSFKEFCKCQYDATGKKVELRHH